MAPRSSSAAVRGNPTTTLLILAAISGWGFVAALLTSQYTRRRRRFLSSANKPGDNDPANLKCSLGRGWAPPGLPGAGQGSGIGAKVVEPLVDTIQGYIQRRSSPLVVGVAGGTGSGKTTFARTLYKNLGEQHVTYISHDSYYKDISHLPVEERAKTNFDHPLSLDTQLLVDHVTDLKEGLAVEIPVYDFSTHSRVKETKRADPRQVIIVEGILIFNDPQLVKLFDIKVFVDTEADVRLIRRIERDVTERKRSLRSIIDQYVTTVRPMHLEFVEPSKRVADLIVPTGINQVALDMFVSRLRHEINADNSVS